MTTDEISASDAKPEDSVEAKETPNAETDDIAVDTSQWEDLATAIDSYADIGNGTGDSEDSVTVSDDATDPIEVEMTLEELAGELESARDEVAQLRDRLLRALAEQENTRKRALRDRRDAQIYGGTRLARDLLPVYDNMNRALSTVDDDHREIAGPLIEGIELTQRELLAAFSRHRILPVEPDIGDRFDPKLHEAMFHAPDAKIPSGCIMAVIDNGFSISERLLRAAQVGVSAGPPPSSTGKSEEELEETAS